MVGAICVLALATAIVCTSAGTGFRGEIKGMVSRSVPKRATEKLIRVAQTPIAEGRSALTPSLAKAGSPVGPALASLAPARAEATEAGSVTGVAPVYVDALAAGWQNWSWRGEVKLSATDYTHSGSYSIAYTATDAKGALYLGCWNGVDTSTYTNLRFYINGGTTGDQSFDVLVSFANDTFGRPVNIREYIKAADWQLVDLPLSALGAGETMITGIVLQDAAGRAQPTIYVDDVELYQKESAKPVDMLVSVDAASDGHAISPLIYGIRPRMGPSLTSRIWGCLWSGGEEMLAPGTTGR